ncbi:MAG: ribonuclease H-like domain-containing protein [Acidobacteriota bacterium]
MSDLRIQLEELRARVARVHARFASKNTPESGVSSESTLSGAALLARYLPAHAARIQNESRSQDGVEDSVQDFIDEEDTWPGSRVVETAEGCHLEAETFYPGHRHHGSADIGALLELPHDLLHVISNGEASAAPPTEWAFLDTETTGLAGGTGTCAFLVGVGRITQDGFRVRQFFMRDYAEEASALVALAEHLAEFRLLITYNGRTFDQPLLETRYRLNRTRPPFSKLDHHVDLLYSSRRLWKLHYDSCRLSELENQVLGVERDGDVPGALIPHLYFEYLRTQRISRLLPVFYHNATDILSLACLTGIVPHAFNDPAAAVEKQSGAPVTLRHGAEMVGLGRWLRQTGELEQAIAMFDLAIQTGLPDDLLFRTMWDVAELHRKRRADARAVAIWCELSDALNPFRVRALEELAKHYEHRTKDRSKALELTRQALQLEDTLALRNREIRLLARLGRQQAAAH